MPAPAAPRHRAFCNNGECAEQEIPIENPPFPAMSLLLVLLLCPLLAVGALSQTVPQSPKTFQELQEDFLILQNIHQQNLDKVRNFQEDFREAFQTPDADEAALRALRLRRDGRELFQSLERDQQRQVTFRNDLSLYSGSRQLIRQESAYSAIYLDTLQKYGQEQQAVTGLLRRHLQQLERSLMQLPPPARLSTALGLDFLLVTPPKGAPFYVSETPLTAEQFRALRQRMDGNLPSQELDRICLSFQKEGVSLPEAFTLADALGKCSGFPCSLPAPAQTAQLKAYGETLKQAVWLSSPQGESPQEKEANLRFGATMAQIWDPQEVTTSLQEPSHILRELPGAKYPELGCLFATSADQGRRHSIALLEKRLQEEDGQAPEAEPELEPAVEKEVAP